MASKCEHQLAYFANSGWGCSKCQIPLDIEIRERAPPSVSTGPNGCVRSSLCKQRFAHLGDCDPRPSEAKPDYPSCYRCDPRNVRYGGSYLCNAHQAEEDAWQRPSEAWRDHPLGPCCTGGRCDGSGCKCPCHPPRETEPCDCLGREKCVRDFCPSCCYCGLELRTNETLRDTLVRAREEFNALPESVKAQAARNAEVRKFADAESEGRRCHACEQVRTDVDELPDSLPLCKQCAKAHAMGYRCGEEMANYPEAPYRFQSPRGEDQIYVCRVCSSRQECTDGIHHSWVLIRKG